jgi:hypothetical protein
MEISQVFVIFLEAALPIYFPWPLSNNCTFLLHLVLIKALICPCTHCLVDVIANNRPNSGLSSTLPDFEKSWD